MLIETEQPANNDLNDVKRAIADVRANNKNRFSYHPTPAEVKECIFKFTGANPEMWRGLNRPIKILEPSAGEGALCDAIKEAFLSEGVAFEITAVEIDPINCVGLKDKGFRPIKGDFLKYEADRSFDIVCMNPPFEGLNFIKHVRHAQKMLSTDGCLVSVIPSQSLVKNKDKKKVAKLRDDAALTLDDTFVFRPGVFETAKKTETRLIELHSNEKMDLKITPELKRIIFDHQLYLTLDNDADLLAKIKQIDWSNDQYSVYSYLVDTLRDMSEKLINDCNVFLPEEWYLEFCLDVYETKLPFILAEQMDQELSKTTHQSIKEKVSTVITAIDDLNNVDKPSANDKKLPIEVTDSSETTLDTEEPKTDTIPSFRFNF